MNKIIIIMVFILVGCGASKETVIKPKMISIETGKIETVIKTKLDEPYENSGNLKTLEYIYNVLDDSTKYTGEKEIEIKGYKTKVKSSFYPKSKEIKIDIDKIKMDTVITDTVSIIKENKKDYMSEMIYYIIIIGILIFLWRTK